MEKPMEKPIKVIYTIHYTANVTEELAEKIYHTHRDGGVLNYPRLLKLIGVDTRDVELTNRADGSCWKPEKKEPQWWGYVHVDGSLHPKKYFDKAYLVAASGIFVKSVHGPWDKDKVTTREEAIEQMKKETEGKDREAEIMNELWRYKK